MTRDLFNGFAGEKGIDRRQSGGNGNADGKETPNGAKSYGRETKAYRIESGAAAEK